MKKPKIKTTCIKIKIMKNQKLLFFLLFLIVPLVNWSQAEKSSSFLHYALNSDVLSRIDVKTGNVLFSVKLKESCFRVTESKSKKTVYVLTKHFGYAINGNDGTIETEFQFTDFLVKESNEHVDPNMFIIPIGLSDNGIGFFINSTDKSNPNYLKTNIIQEINIRDKRVTDVLELDKSKYDAGAIPSYHLNGLHLLKYNQNEHVIAIERREVLNYDKITFTYIPVKQVLINMNEFKTIQCANVFYEDTELASCIILAYVNDISIPPRLFTYKFNLKTNSPISFEEYSTKKQPEVYILLQDCTSEYFGNVSCTEPMKRPIIPSLNPPKKMKKKERAEWLEKSTQRTKEWAIQMKKYNNSINTFQTSCNFKLYSDKEKLNLIGEFTKDQFSAVYIYDDQYIFYNNGYEYVMYDLINKTEIWSMSL